MRSALALISLSRQNKGNFSDEVKYRGAKSQTCVVHGRSAEIGEMVSGCRR